MGALVVADEEGEFLFCSGTLIAPDVFLTAAHCTAAIEQFGLEFLGVTFDSVFDPDTSVVYPGTPYTHPEYPGPSSDAKDIAVVVLDEEITDIQPALLPSAGLLDQLASDGALKGQSFTAVGYGATERTHEPGSGAPLFGEGGTRMYSLSTFAALNKTFLRLSQNPSTGDGGTCYGDSGGPELPGRLAGHRVHHDNRRHPVPSHERHLLTRHAYGSGVPGRIREAAISGVSSKT